jgi:hypothetical protein
MSEDAGAAGTADGATTEASGTQAPAAAPQFIEPDISNSPGRSAEDMLAEAVDAPDDDGDPLARATAEAAKWKDVSLKAEARANKAAATAKANAGAAQKLAAIEDANKTEIQRATDRAVQAEQRAADAEGRYHRTLAAAQHEIPPSLIDLITGATEDEITASAEALAAAINDRAGDIAAASARANGLAQPQRPQSTRPVESLRPGAVPASAPDNNDPNAWIRNAVGRR